LLFLIINITGNIFGKDAVIQNILSQVSSAMGAETATQIEDIFLKVGQPKLTFMGSIIGVIILLIGARCVFVELQKTLNITWEVTAVPKNGILSMRRTRLFSFGLILVVAFSLLIALVISTALEAMSSWIKADSSGLMVIVFNIRNIFFSFAIISVLFALMFKILPDAKIKWKPV
jgi:membrane protein